MIKTDIHFFSVDVLPLVFQFLIDRGIRLENHRAVPYNQVRDVERSCPNNCVILKVKYDV